MSNKQCAIMRWLALGGVTTLLGTAQCGNTADTSGTETHWLAMCSVDADCGGLRCLCGVCTQDCTDDDACQVLAATAVCSTASRTDVTQQCAADPKLCVRASDVSPGAGGSSASPSSTNGGSGGGGGDGSASSASGGAANASSTGVAAAAGAAGASACAAQDARGTGTGACERALGSRWTGETCEPLFACECAGADCGAISRTHQECAEAHAGCFDDQVCSDERLALVDLLNANKSCTDTSDCVTHSAGCGVSEDGCTGTVYSNAALDGDVVRRLALRLATCTSAFEEDSSGCVLCERIPQPPACVDGRCVGADACALEKSVLSSFMDLNDACETVADCTTEVVGCGVSEDGCTGAVYLNEGFDDAEFGRLRSALHACAGDADTCALCEREITPAACVEGRCVAE